MPFVEKVELYSRILPMLTTVLLAMIFSNVLEVKVTHYRDNLEKLKILVNLLWISVLSSNYISDTEPNIVQENAPGVGGWGGTCRCPDGTTYEVGDHFDACNTLACVNGEMVNCNEYEGEWSYRKVICTSIH